AVIIESGLLNMQAEMICDQGASRPTTELNTDRLSIFRQFLRPIDLEIPTIKQQEAREDIRVDSIHSDKAETTQTNTNIARSFLRLTSLDDRVFEQLGRYETNLWRQTAQILLLLSSIEFRPKDSFIDERLHFRRVRRKPGRYPPFDFDPFLRSPGRL